MEWDGASWQPLIRDRELLDWLVQYPSQRELARSRQISTEQMRGLEELWKTDPNATNRLGADGDIAAIDSLLSAEHVDHVLITYEDAQHFQRVYCPLVTLEAEYDKKMKESQAQQNIEIKWDLSLGRKRLMHFKKASGIKKAVSDGINGDHHGREVEETRQRGNNVDDSEYVFLRMFLECSGNSVGTEWFQSESVSLKLVKSRNTLKT